MTPRIKATAPLAGFESRGRQLPHLSSKLQHWFPLFFPQVLSSLDIPGMVPRASNMAVYGGPWLSTHMEAQKTHKQIHSSHVLKSAMKGTNGLS